MPYGVMNGLAVFQHCMLRVLHGLQSGYSKKIVSDYLDVVIIFFKVISMLFTSELCLIDKGCRREAQYTQTQLCL